MMDGPDPNLGGFHGLGEPDPDTNPADLKKQIIENMRQAVARADDNLDVDFVGLYSLLALLGELENW